jgi:hypothetical protein
MAKELFISQSLLKDWDTMCKKQFEFKYFKGYGMDDPESPFFIGDRTMIRFGNYYEQQIIGMSRGGKKTILSKSEIESTKGARIQPQADKAKDWLFNHLDGNVIAVQHYYEAKVEHDGQIVRLSGHVDIHYKYSDGSHQVIDLKLCDNLDSSFGPVINGHRSSSWGDIESMDHTQPIHYTIILQELLGQDVSFIYHVADLTPQMKVKIFPIDVSENTRHMHLSRCLDAQNEIEESLMLDWFEPCNDYNKCCMCPVSHLCEYKKTTPNIELTVTV